MALSRHPKKEIEAVLQYAESRGWRVVQVKRGHNWGRMFFVRCSWRLSEAAIRPQGSRNTTPIDCVRPLTHASTDQFRRNSSA